MDYAQSMALPKVCVVMSECAQLEPMKETYVGVKNYCFKQRVKALRLTCAELAKYVADGWYPRRGDGTCKHDVKRHLCVP